MGKTRLVSFFLDCLTIPTGLSHCGKKPELLFLIHSG